MNWEDSDSDSLQCKTPTGASHTSTDGRYRMAGFMLSGSGIRVFVLGNM